MKKQSIELASLKTKGLQTRAEINEATVMEYIEAEQGGAVLPPVVVFKDKRGSLWLADGFHRVEVARRQARKKVMAEIRQGEFADALKYALLANIGHGLRRTNEDKARAVILVYENRALLGLPDVPSARSVAELAGVSHTFANNHLATVAEWIAAERRTKADGKEYTIPQRIRPPQGHVTSTEGGAAMAETPPAPPPMPPSRVPEMTPPPPQREKPVEVAPVEAVEPVYDFTAPRDNLGREVKPALVELWNRRGEIAELAGLVSKVRVAIRDAQDGGDTLFAEMNFSSVLSYLDRAYTELSAAVPWCVCAMCQGIGCAACKGRGLMGKFRYDQIVPSGIKKTLEANK